MASNPRMLRRTLKRLRERKLVNGKSISVRKFCKLIGRSKGAVSNYETGVDALTFDVLYRYQLVLGVPNGIILAISHVAAMSRDASTHGDPEVRARERAKLKLIASYLRNLADRIDRPGKRPRLWGYPKLEAEFGESWDVLLEDICIATQRGHDMHLPTLFEDLALLKELMDKERDAVADGQAKAKQPPGRASRP